MPYVTVGKENSGDIDLYYEDHGSGKPVVLIHGYPLNGASWEKQTAALLAAGHRVIPHGRPGFRKPTAFRAAGFPKGGSEVPRSFGKYGSKGVTQAIFISPVPPFLLKTVDNP